MSYGCLLYIIIHFRKIVIVMFGEWKLRLGIIRVTVFELGHYYRGLTVGQMGGRESCGHSFLLGVCHEQLCIGIKLVEDFVEEGGKCLR